MIGLKTIDSPVLLLARLEIIAVIITTSYRDWETVLGYTKDEMLSEDFNYLSIIHEDDLERVSKEISFYTKDRNSYEQSR